MAATRSFGTILRRETSIGSGTFTNLAGIVDLQFPEIAAEMADSTAMDSSGGYREQVPTLLMLNDFTVTLHYDSAEATHEQLTADCVARQVRLYQVVGTDTGLVNWAFSAYVSRVAPGATVRGLHTLSVTFSPTGAVTRT